MSKKKSTKAAPAASKGTTKGSSKGTGPMDVGLLQQIVDLMAANDLNTVDLRDGDRRVVLKRGQEMTMAAPVSYAAPAAAPVAASAPAPTGATAGTEAADSNLIPIKSPMVGTFYSASSPDAKPFVTVGSTVDDDTDVCIIEAMKVFNNIKAECRGTIAKINVENGAPVEFGQILFLVKP